MTNTRPTLVEFSWSVVLGFRIGLMGLRIYLVSYGVLMGTIAGVELSR